MRVLLKALANCISRNAYVRRNYMPVQMAEKCDGTESLPVHLSRLHHPLAYKMMCKQSKAMIKVRGKVTTMEK